MGTFPKVYLVDPWNGVRRGVMEVHVEGTGTPRRIVSAAMALLAAQAMARTASAHVRELPAPQPSPGTEAVRAAVSKPSYRGATRDVVDAIARTFGENGRSVDGLVQLAFNSCPQFQACDSDSATSLLDQWMRVYNPGVPYTPSGGYAMQDGKSVGTGGDNPNTPKGCQANPANIHNLTLAAGQCRPWGWGDLNGGANMDWNFTSCYNNCYSACYGACYGACY